MNSFSTEAIVLKRRDFGEADRLVTFFTKNRGKVVALAKGVRKVNSRRAPNIEQLNHVKIFLHETRSLPILTEAEEIKSFSRLKDDLKKLSLSYLLLELVDQFLEQEQENKLVFDLLERTLTAINESGDLETIRLLLSSFQLKFLTQVGYLPQLYECARCARNLVPENNFLSPNLGGVVGQECASDTLISRKVSSQAIKALRFLQSQPLNIVKKLNLHSKIIKETEDLLHYYTIYFLEQDLASLAFVSAVDKVVG